MDINAPYLIFQENQQILLSHIPGNWTKKNWYVIITWNLEPILSYITNYLDVKDAISLGSLSKKFNNLIANHHHETKALKYFQKIYNQVNYNSLDFFAT